MSRQISERASLLVIVLVYIALAMTYALATPPLESSDEYTHYPVVQYIQTEHSLPILDPDNPGLWLQEGAQPPLYYLIMASLTSWIDTSDLAEIHRANPHAFIGNPNQIANKNLILHDLEREAFPWHGTVFAIYLIRLASICLGAGSVLMTALLGRAVFGPKVGLLAASLTALNPMFLFVNAAVNNDSLSILLGSTGLYLLVRVWQDVPDPTIQWRRYAGLGLALGLGMLTKLSLAGLLPLAGVALAWLAWRRHRWQLLFRGGLMTAIVALALPSWWFLRNLRIYQDLTGLDMFVAVQGIRDSPIYLADWIGEFGTLYRSFWGLFGGVNVAAPNLVYWIYNLAAVFGLVGLAKRSSRAHSRNQGGLWLLVAWALILFLLLLQWNTIYFSFQGRLIFPALAGINVLWAVGLLAWTRNKGADRVALAVVCWMLATATLLPWTTIRPAYAYPEPLATVPEQARFGPITFAADEGEIQLVGVEMKEHQSVMPAGEPVELVLYWRAGRPVQKDYVSSVHLLGRGLASVGQVNRYPGWGMIPTSDWKAGQIWRDVYHIYVKRGADGPTRLRVSIGLYDAQESAPLSPVGPDGITMTSVIVGRARLAQSPGEALEAPHPLEVALSDGITLAGYSMEPQPAVAGDSIALTLFWQASASPTRAYTVFVHLQGPDGSQLAGADGPPVAGDYPTTMWEAGDQVDDLHIITLPPDLPPGEYMIELGLYDPTTGIRADRLDEGGTLISLPVMVTERQ